jgi:hypothetical protein
VSILPYSQATSGEKALVELQRTLAKFGCQSFGTMTDAERGCMIVAFKWRNRSVQLEASWKGYAQALLNAKSEVHRSVRGTPQERALAQAKISVCSILRDWVKGQTTAVECGIMSFEAAFMPHMLLPSGERVIDRVKAENLLPAPPEERIVKIKP